MTLRQSRQAGGIVRLNLKSAVLCFGLTMCILPAAGHAAQQKTPVAPAPIPVQIVSARKVFIANGGVDESPYSSLYTGGPDRAYNEFYALMKTWGRYQLVTAPADADLVFDIRLTVTDLQTRGGLSDASAATDSQFRIVIRDVKTHEALWALTEHIELAVLQGNRDKNFEQALAAVFAEVQRIVGPAALPSKN
jgi:hypothetical protein